MNIFLNKLKKYYLLRNIFLKNMIINSNYG